MVDASNWMSVSFVMGQLNETDGVQDVQHSERRDGNHVFEVDFDTPLTDEEVMERFEHPFDQYETEFEYRGDDVETWDELTLVIKNDLL